MPLALRILSWARSAPRSHVATSSVFGVALVVLMLLAALPTGNEAMVGTSGFIPGAPADVPAAGDGPVGGTTAGTAGAVASGDAARGTQEVVADSGAGAAAQDGTAVAADSGAGTPAPNADAPSGGEGAAPTTTAAPTNEPLVASDRGISADQIKIGFLIVEIAGADAGTVFGWRSDRDQAIEAMVDWLNRNGGLAGREVVYTTAKSDLRDSASQRAACLKLAQDDEVFFVADVAGTDGTNHLCYPEQGLLHSFPTSAHLTEEQYVQSGGFNIVSGASASRIVQNWASFMLGTKEIAPGAGRLGLLTEECEPSPRVIDGDLKPILSQAGIDYVETRLSCDTDTAQRQATGAALEMKNAGVDRVAIFTGLTGTQAFLNAARVQRWQPQYLASDFNSVTKNAIASTYPPEQFDGALALTWSSEHSTKPGEAQLSPAAKTCSTMLTEADLDPVTDPSGRDSQVVAYCDALLLLRTGLASAPRNPTRVDFIRSVEAMGEFPSALAHHVRFGPRRYAGADSWAFLEFRVACRCWVRVSEFAAGKG